MSDNAGRGPAAMGKATKKYLVVAEVTISMSTEVFASSKKEAMGLAMERPLQGLCHQCASSGVDRDEEWCTSGELDGEPMNLTAEALDEY